MILTLTASFLLSATKCNPEAPKFQWSPEIWATDSREQVIIRKDIVIKTSDPLFDEYISMKADEIPKAKQAYFDVINQCEKWKPNSNYQEMGDSFDTLGVDKGE